MAKGKIKFYNTIKGYGFIVTEESTDLFFHISEFVNMPDDILIVKDAEVVFEIGKGKNGDKAVKIQLREEDNQEVF